jgi:hypothetical protein
MLAIAISAFAVSSHFRGSTALWELCGIELHPFG